MAQLTYSTRGRAISRNLTGLGFGQSNWEGTNPARDYDNVTNPRVRFWDQFGSAIGDDTLLKWTTGAPGQQGHWLGDYQGDHIGYWMMDALQRGYGGTMRMVSHSEGGESIEDFVKGGAGAHPGEDWNQMSSKIRDSFASSELQNIGKNRFDFAAFCQGEADHFMSDAQWAAHLKTVIAQLRTSQGGLYQAIDDDTPILVFELLQGGANSSKNAVISAMEDGSFDPAVRPVSSAGIPHDGDGVHYTARGLQELGRRGASVLEKIIFDGLAISPPAEPGDTGRFVTLQPNVTARIVPRTNWGVVELVTQVTGRYFRGSFQTDSTPAMSRRGDDSSADILTGTGVPDGRAQGADTVVISAGSDGALYLRSSWSVPIQAQLFLKTAARNLS